MSAEDLTKRCYICNHFFDDRVKLGMHLSACYDEAVNVRKELWHPHPLDLVSDQHYTAYMANKHKYTIEQLKDAHRRGVSFVTDDNFCAIKGHLRGSPGHASNVAQPARTGVTQLKSELSSELERLRAFREEEERRVAEREARFEHLCESLEGRVGVVGGRSRQRPESGRCALPLMGKSPHSASPQCSPESNHHSAGAGEGWSKQQLVVVRDAGASPTAASGRPPSRSSHHYPLPQATGSTFSPIAGAVPFTRPAPAPQVASAPLVSVRPGTVERAAVNRPRVMDDGRIECPVCRKLFGRRGFEVHSKRCGLDPSEDFTFSQDARLHEEKAGRMKITEAPRRPEEDDEKWTQFMTTYPRPVLEESPHSPQARSKAAETAAQRREYEAMRARELQRPAAGARTRK